MAAHPLRLPAAALEVLDLVFNPRRILRHAAILSPSTLLRFHRALKRHKYRWLYSRPGKASAGTSNILHACSTAIQWLQNAVRARNRHRRFYTMYSLVVICIHYVIMETWHKITKKGCCGLSASWGCSARVTCNRRAFHECIWPNSSSRANC